MRRRLTVAFVAVAAVTATALAVSSYALVREYRVRARVERAVEVSRLNLAIAPRTLAPSNVDALLDHYRRLTDVSAVIQVGNRVYSSRDSFGIDEVPPTLREEVTSGTVIHRQADVMGVPYLVTGGRVAGGDATLYFFFSMEELVQSLELLRNVLIVGGVTLTLLAAVVGSAIARRTLAPVRRAADAARSLAEGLLDTRLPIVKQDEFGAWASYFNDMAAALEDKITALSAAHSREVRFTSDVAHELRTPLSSLVGASSILAGYAPQMPPEARRPAELVALGIQRLRRLVDELMELSRLDAGRESFLPEHVELGDAVASMIRAYGWQETVRLNAEPVVVSVDRRCLDRVVVNFLTNAIEHGGRDVDVRVRRAGNEALVEVRDGGPGIAPEHLPHVFERFYKVDSARSKGGSGLGLAIAKENADLVGGSLDVSSRPGQGTEFVLRLPVADTRGPNGHQSGTDQGIGSRALGAAATKNR